MPPRPNDTWYSALKIMLLVAFAAGHADYCIILQALPDEGHLNLRLGVNARGLLMVAASTIWAC